MVENKYLVNNKISSQYFVIYPLLAMTEVKRFLEVFTRFSHTVAGILAHSSMQISSRAVMFWDFQLPPKIFYGVEIWRLARPLQDLEMLLTKPLLRCPGGVFGIIVMLKDPAIFNALADGRRFSLKISWYMAPFLISFTQISRSGPLAEKQPQSMMFPPPCFTVGMVFFGCNSAFFLLQTRQVEFLPKSYILVSSDHMTFSQSSSGSSKCSLANFRRAWTCTGLSRGTRLALQDLSPWRRSVLLMVAFVTLVPALCRSFTRSPVWFWDFCSQFLWSFWPHGVRSCVEPQIEGDYQWSCMSSTF